MTEDELIAKLEAATEGSRELNEAIHRYMKHKQSGRWSAQADYDYGFCLYDEVDGGYDTIPNYTTSIDAALTLAPEWWYWSVVLRDTPYGDATGEAVIHNNRPHHGKDRIAFDNFGNTPALAICISALKARKKTL